jgi:hypothetical protein
VVRTPRQKDAVFLLMTASGMCKSICQVTVIGHQDETFTLEIQPANRLKMARHIDQIAHGLAHITAFVLNR